MPAFTFNSPDGKSYTVNGPDGATSEQAFAQLQSGLKNGAIKPDAPAAPAAPPEPTPMATQVGHLGMDVAGTVARGVGDVVGAGKNVVHMVKGEPTEDPTETGQDFAHPFQHDPDVPNAVERGVNTALSYTPGGLAASGIRKLAQTKPVQDALNSNEGRLVTDIVKPVSEIGQAAATVMGAKGAVGAGADALDTGINAINRNTPAQASRIGANQQIVRARADGFKATANDVRGNTNPADAAKPNADLPGPSTTTPDVADKVNVHNQKLATQKMAEDVKLPNTRNINPDEVEERMGQEASVYNEVGDAIGAGRTPSTALDHDISAAGSKSADPEVQSKIDKRVDFYRDQFKDGFDGPRAVQTIRTLRNDAAARALSDDPAEQAMGKTHQAIADAIEDEMMRQLPAGAQDLHTRFPQARQQLAKLYELQEVSEGGQVNPARVLKLRTGGKPLSGAADAVANAAEALPESMQGPRGSPSRITTAPTPGRGIAIDAWNLAKSAVHKIPGMNPTTDAYQAAHYGEVGGSSATPPSTIAPNVSPIRPPVRVVPPAGDVGVLKRQTEMPLPAGPEGPPAYAMDHPPGSPIEPAQREMPLPEPLPPRRGGGPLLTAEEWEAQAKAALAKKRGRK